MNTDKRGCFSCISLCSLWFKWLFAVKSEMDLLQKILWTTKNAKIDSWISLRPCVSAGEFALFAVDSTFSALSIGGRGGARTHEPHGCEPCALTNWATHPNVHKYTYPGQILQIGQLLGQWKLLKYPISQYLRQINWDSTLFLRCVYPVRGYTSNYPVRIKYLLAFPGSIFIHLPLFTG